MNLNNVIFYGTFDFLELGVSHCLDIHTMNASGSSGNFFFYSKTMVKCNIANSNKIILRIFWEHILLPIRLVIIHLVWISMHYQRIRKKWKIMNQKMLHSASVLLSIFFALILKGIFWGGIWTCFLHFSCSSLIFFRERIPWWVSFFWFLCTLNSTSR